MQRKPQPTRRKNTIVAVGEGSTKLPAESEVFEVAVTTFLRHCRIKNLTSMTLEYYLDVLSMLRKLLTNQGIDRPMDVT